MKLHIEFPPRRLALLDISNGDPPPVPPVFGCVFAVVFEWLELVATEPLSEVVEDVSPIPDSEDSSEEVELAAAEVAIVRVLGTDFVVDFTVAELVDCVAFEEVVFTGAAVVELTNPRPPVTPAESVGIVTERESTETDV
jgi:hypothetical protein